MSRRKRQAAPIRVKVDYDSPLGLRSVADARALVSAMSAVYGPGAQADDLIVFRQLLAGILDEASDGNSTEEAMAFVAHLVSAMASLAGLAFGHPARILASKTLEDRRVDPVVVAVLAPDAFREDLFILIEKIGLAF